MAGAQEWRAAGGGSRDAGPATTTAGDSRDAERATTTVDDSHDAGPATATAGDSRDAGPATTTSGDTTALVRARHGPAQGPDAAGRLAALTRAADDALGVDLDPLDDRALLAYTTELDRQITRLEAARARLLSTVATRRAFEAIGHVTAGSWWRDATNRTHADAARAATTARRVRQLPAVWAAWQAGEIATRQVDIIARAASPRRMAAFAAAQHALVDVARNADANVVRRVCRGIADQTDPTPDPPPDTPGRTADGHDVRGELTLGEGFDGLWNLSGTLDSVVGARFAALLDTLMRPDPPETPDELATTPAQRRHAALDRILRAAEQHPDLGTIHGARPHVLVLIDLARLLAGEPAAARLGGMHHPLDRDAAVELLYAGKLTPVATWGRWRPVAFGDTRRTLPGWLRPLLAAVHGHCRGPGCDRRVAWTQAAHLDPWVDHRDTRLERTLPLCQRHHELLDRHGWTAAYDPDTAIVTWTSPDGHATTTHPLDPDPPTLSDPPPRPESPATGRSGRGPFDPTREPGNAVPHDVLAKLLKSIIRRPEGTAPGGEQATPPTPVDPFGSDLLLDGAARRGAARPDAPTAATRPCTTEGTMRTGLPPPEP